MSVDDLEGSLWRMRMRYRSASTREKGRLLDEFCAVLRCHRTSAIRTLWQDAESARSRPGRPPVAGTVVMAPLEIIWEGKRIRL